MWLSLPHLPRSFLLRPLALITTQVRQTIYPARSQKVVPLVFCGTLFTGACPRTPDSLKLDLYIETYNIRARKGETPSDPLRPPFLFVIFIQEYYYLNQREFPPETPTCIIIIIIIKLTYY
jgi:hypothetical protein